MSDIKQAAKWMKEGKKVRRPHWPATDAVILTPCIRHEGESSIIASDHRRVIFHVDALLADDWEIAE